MAKAFHGLQPEVLALTIGGGAILGHTHLNQIVHHSVYAIDREAFRAMTFVTRMDPHLTVVED